MRQMLVHIGERFRVIVPEAVEPEDRRLGLGQRTSIEPGMLFRQLEGDLAVHNAGMLVPFDVVWIHGNARKGLRVTGLFREIPPSSRASVWLTCVGSLVLELPAGVIEARGLSLRDAVRLALALEEATRLAG